MRTLLGQAEGEDPLSGLAAVRQMRHETDQLEAVLVRRARVAGSSWKAIAAMLGVSRQAVHKKYGGSRFSRD
ncbi:AsnC family protein [Georgenia thermotolerans]|nr:AsnC family protein [Georgenia thermotolerans]